MRSIALCILLLAAVVLAESAEEAPTDDTRDDGPCAGRVGTTFCGDCMTEYDCTHGTLVKRPCITGDACIESGDEANCVPELIAGNCSCTGKLSQCDPFNSSIVMVCRPDGGVLVATPCGDDMQCYGGECAHVTTPQPPPPCQEEDANTWQAIGVHCTSFAFCMSDQTTAIKYDCDPGFYYDEIVNECTEAPPKACTGCDVTLCPDPNDCSAYHSCAGGEVTSSFQCKGDTNMFFDYKHQTCSNDSETCDPRVACGFGSDGTFLGGRMTTPLSQSGY